MHTSSSSSAAADHQLGLARDTGKTDFLLHSIRKPPGAAAAAAKPWKKPIAGPPPTRVYMVDPHGFRQLVQKLTGAPQQQQHRPGPLPPQQQQLLLGYSRSIQGSSNGSVGGSPHQLQMYFSSEATKKSNGGGNSMPEASQFMFPSTVPPTSYPLLSPATTGAVSLMDQYTTLL